MLDIHSEAEFQKLMEEIDTELRRDSVPIVARQMEGARRIAARYNLVLPFPRNEDRVRDGVYTGTDLAVRISSWFRDRYGDRLKIDWCREHTIVLIRGDAYCVRLPTFFGQVNFYCDPSDHGKPKSDGAKCNVLNLIEGLESNYSAQFSNDELAQLHYEITYAILAFYNAIEWLYRLPYGETIHSEYEGAVSTLLERHYGASRWNSLQAVEKALKAVITKGGAIFPKTGKLGHDLQTLVDCAKAIGMSDPGSTLVSIVQCSAGVRYGEDPSTLLQAAAAHRASIALGKHIAEFSQTIPSTDHG